MLTGPPGAGKTTSLRELAGRLEGDGLVPVYLDLMAAASSPERFVTAALDVLPAAEFGHLVGRATEIRTIAGRGRQYGAEAVGALFELWATIETAAPARRPVVLLFDEATEIRSLAYFKGLRDVATSFGAALAGRRYSTILATSFPTLAGRLWRFPMLPTRPLGLADLADRLGSAAARDLLSLTFGWPRYVRVLLDSDLGPREAWTREMTLGGRLEVACRATYESLLLRSRGYGICKAALAVIASDDSLNLTALVARLGRSPGAVRDYLQWLVGVDALRVTKRRYHFVDGLVREWVRLHARGSLATPAEIEAAADRLLSRVADETASATGPLVVGPAPDRNRRTDSLMEID